jgi:hypothetical protein
MEQKEDKLKKFRKTLTNNCSLLKPNKRSEYCNGIDQLTDIQQLEQYITNTRDLINSDKQNKKTESTDDREKRRQENIAKEKKKKEEAHDRRAKKEKEKQEKAQARREKQEKEKEEKRRLRALKQNSASPLSLSGKSKK